ncbi:MAG: DUF933 domain-containing protein [Candidatus Omnitrophota bacterium]
MKIAIVGFSGSGKSTVFKAITNFKRPTGDYSKPCLGAVKVKDERLEKLAVVFKPQKIVHEELVFTDLPGFTLSAVKNEEVIMHVVGAFSGRGYARDIDDMEAEFLISDLAIIEKKLPSLEKELMTKPSVEKELEKNVLLECKQALDGNMPIRSLKLPPEKEKAVSGYQFLSQKPLFVVVNLEDGQAGSRICGEVSAYCLKKGFRGVSFPAQVEAEIQDLDEKERVSFAREMGIRELGADSVVRVAREVAGLITFFTGSHDGVETRAWPIRNGTTALDAAGKIHSDLKKGFIRAEVVSYDDFVKCGSLNEAKAKGVLRLEGKEYVVNDGDLITFRFSV